ncbi:putative membrane protein [Propionispora sp. 2/2-37]|uniref:hypothetical protein n=1 Tax=Propionispora sp. 2/2-37 TaxID=1677858 RepID=UPI0006C39E67|nr:hypothetical protein [Propionispora sp. 2/2-37]CUH95650.1 putative membrane protein [Propionispora sp. 2/2-37]
MSNTDYPREDFLSIKEKLFIIGGYSVFALVVTALVLYGASHGIYIDPANLS